MTDRRLRVDSPELIAALRFIDEAGHRWRYRNDSDPPPLQYTPLPLIPRCGWYPAKPKGWRP